MADAKSAYAFRVDISGSDPAQNEHPIWRFDDFTDARTIRAWPLPVNGRPVRIDLATLVESSKAHLVLIYPSLADKPDIPTYDQIWVRLNHRPEAPFGKPILLAGLALTGRRSPLPRHLTVRSIGPEARQLNLLAYSSP